MRKVDKAQFVENEFDKEMFFGGKFGNSQNAGGEDVKYTN